MTTIRPLGLWTATARPRLNTPKRWRLVSYHPTWGEDWRHFATYYEAIQARARLLALPSDGTAYTIEPCQEAGR